MDTWVFVSWNDALVSQKGFTYWIRLHFFLGTTVFRTHIITDISCDVMDKNHMKMPIKWDLIPTISHFFFPVSQVYEHHSLILEPFCRRGIFSSAQKPCCQCQGNCHCSWKATTSPLLSKAQSISLMTTSDCQQAYNLILCYYF